MNRKYLKGLLLVMLLLSNKEQTAFFELESLKDQLYDWKPWTAMISMAGMGACIYKYHNQPRETITEIEPYKQKAENFYQSLLHMNADIIKYYDPANGYAADRLINAIVQKGKTHPYVRSKFAYASEDCRNLAPILRGVELLIVENNQLWDFKNKIVEFYGSEQLALQEFKLLNSFIEHIQKINCILKLAKQHVLYHTSQTNFDTYKAVQRLSFCRC